MQTGTDNSRGGGAANGIKIVFAGSDGEARTLYYFSTNLADDGVKSSGFLKFCETLAPGDSFIKSASYLLHSGGFAKVRDFLLANSAAMVQDDSGIPLQYYDPQKWDLQPFGRYLGPIGVFPGRYQQRYAELFRKSKPIDFGIGYRHRPGESNLLLAVKKASVTGEEMRKNRRRRRCRFDQPKRRSTEHQEDTRSTSRATARSGSGLSGADDVSTGYGAPSPRYRRPQPLIDGYQNETHAGRRIMPTDCCPKLRL